MKREVKIRIVREHLIPLLDREFDDLDQSSVEDDNLGKVENILAEAYVDNGTRFPINLLKVILPVAFLDVLYPMPAVIYGLVISMVGTWILLVDADILGRRSIAYETEITSGVYSGSTINERKARRLARNTVTTNIGLVWLTLGFLFQIIAEIFFPGTSIISTDLM